MEQTCTGDSDSKLWPLGNAYRWDEAGNNMVISRSADVALSTQNFVFYILKKKKVLPTSCSRPCAGAWRRTRPRWPPRPRGSGSGPGQAAAWTPRSLGAEKPQLTLSHLLLKINSWIFHPCRVKTRKIRANCKLNRHGRDNCRTNITTLDLSCELSAVMSRLHN